MLFRSVEADYMRALSDALGLEDWSVIVTKAVEDAKAGDPKAREWVARYALGSGPSSLRDLAVDDVLIFSSDDDIAAQAAIEREKAEGGYKFFTDEPTPLALTIQQRDQAVALAQEQAEQEQRRAQREARKAARLANTTKPNT